MTQDRLTKALDLVLSNAVALYQGNTTSVYSRSRGYTVANGDGQGRRLRKPVAACRGCEQPQGCTKACGIPIRR